MCGRERRQRTHDVGLSADSDQPVDVFTDGNEHFAGHVSALLRPGCLVFDVYSSSALLDEQLCELHDGCEATMSRVRICNDRAQIVCLRQLRAVCFGCCEAFFALFPVVEELCHEEMLHLVWYSGLAPGQYDFEVTDGKD
jgi:hypothetical protein